MSRDIAFYMVDILIASDKIRRYTQKFTNPTAFLHSELEWDATIRELEIIGEATNKLLQANILDPQYRMIVDFRNQIVHGYFTPERFYRYHTKHCRCKPHYLAKSYSLCKRRSPLQPFNPGFS